MRSLRTVTLGRSTCLAAGVLFAGSLFTIDRDAHACGATPTEVQALLPLDGATNWPLNAVLIASANSSLAVFELREMAAAADGVQTNTLEPPADAGAIARGDAGAPGQVALDVDCNARALGAGALCVATPREPLKPRTRYTWRTNVAWPDGYRPPADLDVWHEFTTGSARDDQPLSADATGFIVTDSERSSDPFGNPCGITHWMTIAYSLRASEPAVLHYAGYTPSYVMHATRLMPGEEVSATLYNPPDCLSAVLYDAAGHRTPLPEWCSSEITPAPPAPPAPAPPAADAPDAADDEWTSSGSPSEPPAEATESRRRRALCALSTPPMSTHDALPTLGGLGALLLLLSKRRRRTP
jgi:hypothetical protein